MTNTQPDPQWQQPNYRNPDQPQPGPQQPLSPQAQQPWVAPGQWNPNPGGVASQEERTWATLAHLSAPIAWIVSAGWLSIAGPLIIWLLYRDKSWFVRNAAAGAFNFTLTMWLVSVIGWFLTFTVILLPIGIPSLALISR